MRRLAWLAPYLALGPLTGPLAAAAHHYFRRGEPVIGTLYLFAIGEVFVLLPLAAARLGISAVHLL